MYSGNNKIVIYRTVKFLEHGVNSIKQDENNTQERNIKVGILKENPSENIKVDLNGVEQDQIIVPQQAPVEPRKSLK